MKSSTMDLEEANDSFEGLISSLISSEEDGSSPLPEDFDYQSVLKKPATLSVDVSDFYSLQDDSCCEWPLEDSFFALPRAEDQHRSSYLGEADSEPSLSEDGGDYDDKENCDPSVSCVTTSMPSPIVMNHSNTPMKTANKTTGFYLSNSSSTPTTFSTRSSGSRGTRLVVSFSRKELNKNNGCSPLRKVYRGKNISDGSLNNNGRECSVDSIFENRSERKSGNSTVITRSQLSQSASVYSDEDRKDTVAKGIHRTDNHLLLSQKRSSDELVGNVLNDILDSVCNKISDASVHGEGALVPSKYLMRLQEESSYEETKEGDFDDCSRSFAGKYDGMRKERFFSRIPVSMSVVCQTSDNCSTDVSSTPNVVSSETVYSSFKSSKTSQISEKNSQKKSSPSRTPLPQVTSSNSLSSSCKTSPHFTSPSKSPVPNSANLIKTPLQQKTALYNSPVVKTTFKNPHGDLAKTYNHDASLKTTFTDKCLNFSLIDYRNIVPDDGTHQPEITSKIFSSGVNESHQTPSQFHSSHASPPPLAAPFTTTNYNDQYNQKGHPYFTKSKETADYSPPQPAFSTSITRPADKTNETFKISNTLDELALNEKEITLSDSSHCCCPRSISLWPSIGNSSSELNSEKRQAVTEESNGELMIKENSTKELQPTPLLRLSNGKPDGDLGCDRVSVVPGETIADNLTTGVGAKVDCGDSRCPSRRDQRLLPVLRVSDVSAAFRAPRKILLQMLATIWEEYEDVQYELPSLSDSLGSLYEKDSDSVTVYMCKTSSDAWNDAIDFRMSIPASEGKEATTIWLTLPGCTVLDLMTSSSRASLSGGREPKKKTVQFALPGRIIRPLQWRDDVIWARVETPRKRSKHVPLEHLFPASHVPGHHHSSTGSDGPDSDGNFSSQEDTQSSSSKDSVSNVVILSCSGERSVVQINSDTHSIDRADSRSDSDYVSKGDSSESSLQCSGTESDQPSPVGTPSQGCMHCALMKDSVHRINMEKQELETKVRSYEDQIRSLNQACTSLELTLREEKSLHTMTRQELGRILDRLKFYTGNRAVLGTAAALRDYRAPSRQNEVHHIQSVEHWKRTFRKSKGAKVQVAETKYQVINLHRMEERNTDIGVQVNLHSRLDEERGKLTKKMRYGIAAVFHDKSQKTNYLSGQNQNQRDSRISKPLHSVITEKENALNVLSKEVKLLQEERDHLQQLLNQHLPSIMPPNNADQRAQEAENQLKSLMEQNKQLLENYNAERILRKKYYNMVEDLKGKIRVYCRIRPLTNNELNREGGAVLESVDSYTLLVHSPRGQKEFQFDRIFMPQTSQDDVFRETEGLVQSAMDGYNVCIFAYGQTGSGKTFTLTGRSQGGDEPGIAPRAFRQIFQLVKENEQKQAFTLTASFLELYNERFLDLLKDNSAPEEKLEVKKDSNGHTYVPGATVEEVTSSDQLMDLFIHACRNRHVASTKMNSESSRSHFISTILITSTNHFTGSVLRGKLSLVDLAGSEKTAKSGVTGEHIKEANCINKSLSALGDVIQALATQQPHVPYRNNKLTMLMQDSLGGTAKTLMFVNVSPSHFNVEETLNSLLYATRVRQIKNDVTRASETKEIAKLKSIISKLKKDIGSERDVS